MCTVTYIPSGPLSFILTSNRDENILRKQAAPPKAYNISHKKVFFPMDSDSHGTWFAVEQDSFTLCLLNGAFQKHEHRPPYRLSRGLMLLDFFNYMNVHDFISTYDFKDIEPFTLLIIESAGFIQLNEIRWDGSTIHFMIKDSSLPHIWSSAMLYPASVIALREDWFAEWLKGDPEKSIKSSVSFHKTAGSGDRISDLVMNWDDKVFTVSITSAEKNNGSGKIYYEDLITNTISEILLDQKK